MERKKHKTYIVQDGERRLVVVDNLSDDPKAMRRLELMMKLAIELRKLLPNGIAKQGETK